MSDFKMPDFSGFKPETDKGMHVLITRNSDKENVYEADVDAFFCGSHDVFDDEGTASEIFFAKDAKNAEVYSALGSLFRGVRKLIDDGSVPADVMKMAAFDGGGFVLHMDGSSRPKGGNLS